MDKIKNGFKGMTLFQIITLVIFFAGWISTLTGAGIAIQANAATIQELRAGCGILDGRVDKTDIAIVSIDTKLDFLMKDIDVIKDDVKDIRERVYQ